MEAFKKIFRTPSAFVLLLVAIVSLIGIIIQSKTNENIARIPIDATSTAEARLIQTVPISSPPLTATEPTDWAFTLEYRFPYEFWSVGTHSYFILYTCPEYPPQPPTSLGINHSFTVSDSYSFITGYVYLGSEFLSVGNPWGNSRVEGINPSQRTVAAVGEKSITKSEAEWRVLNCTGTISWDDKKTPELMTPQISFQP